MATALHSSQDQDSINVKKRLDTFQFRWNPNAPPHAMPASPTASSTTTPTARSRSHSRNGSLSASISAPSDLFSTPLSASNSRPSSLVGRPRPSSHHRRRSSVSTRVDSADMMGVALPDLPPASSDDNINFGDRDSIRRRALNALEGKQDFVLARTTQVEIPDFNAQGVPQKPLDSGLKASLSVPFGLSSSSSGKRDSFGKYMSIGSSLKDQLHTLMEEEEEDEEEEEEENYEDAQEESSAEDELAEEGDLSIAAPKGGAGLGLEVRAPTPEVTPSSVAPARHRPANLNLRPLSLIQCAAASPSPPVTSRPSLKPFALSCQSDRQANEPARAEPSASLASRRTSLSSGDFSHGAPSPKRNSSISYIRSGASPSPPTQFTLAGLPTPGATPTSERRESASSLGSFSAGSRRNASEEIFFQASHATLLARVTELERVLNLRAQARPESLQSSAGSVKSEEAEGTGAALVAQLRSERDELNRDVEGWRKRVRDLEQAKALLAHEKTVLEHRLEAEKREAWLKAEKSSLLDMENGNLARQLKLKEEQMVGISRTLESTQAQLQRASMECETLRDDAETMKRQLGEAQELAHELLSSRKTLQEELASVRAALAAEQAYRAQLTAQLDAKGVLQTPRVPDQLPPKGLKQDLISHAAGAGFTSIDSLSTTVDVEESLKAPFTLKAVEEESGRSAEEEDDESADELAGYEDEDELDYGNSPLRCSSSYGSDDDFPRSLSHLRIAANGTPVASSAYDSHASTPSPTSSPCPTPLPPLEAEVADARHVKNRSLSKTWKFPSGVGKNAPRAIEEVDHFFGCLEDVEDSHGAKRDTRTLFSQRLQFCTADDEEALPPFVLPAQKSPLLEGMLAAVVEEDEEECDTPDGRILRFPVSVSSLSQDSLCETKPPAFAFAEDSPAEAVPFVFPQMRSQTGVVQTPPSRAPLAKAASASPVSHIPVSRAVPILSPPPTSNPRTGAGAARALQPSRIPPPSPPTFITAKPPVRPFATPSPPKRKPVPAPSSPAAAAAAKTSPGAYARSSPLSTTTTTRGIGNAAAQSGSTFIPQLRALNVNVNSSFLDRSESEGALLGGSLRGESTNTATTTTARPREETQCQSQNQKQQQLQASTSTSSGQALFSTVSSLLPLPSLSAWMTKATSTATDGREPARAAVPGPVFVSREKQLLRLRASLPAGSKRAGTTSMDVCACRRCRGGVVSL